LFLTNGVIGLGVVGGKGSLKASREKNMDKEIEKFIKKIEDAKIPVKDEWSEGLNMGLDWAIRILMKDKSAY
jgi:hypothetical protein